MRRMLARNCDYGQCQKSVPAANRTSAPGMEENPMSTDQGPVDRLPPYNREAERGVLWNDPDLALPWPVANGDAVLSEKDKTLPTWSETGALF